MILLPPLFEMTPLLFSGDVSESSNTKLPHDSVMASFLSFKVMEPFIRQPSLTYQVTDKNIQSEAK